MTSLNTQNSFRDGHLKNKPDFFDVAKYKKATFEASEIIKNPESGKFAYIAKGKLTLKGVTKEEDLFFSYVGSDRSNEKDENGKEHKIQTAGFEGETIINRKDFGITGSSVSDNVKIEISLEAAKEEK